MIALELKELVDRYIHHEINIAEFEDQLAPRIFDLISEAESPDSKLVAAIELGRVDMSDGSSSEDEFRAMLTNELRKHVNALVFYPVRPDRTQTSSANKMSSAVDVWADRESSPVWA